MLSRRRSMHCSPLLLLQVEPPSPGRVALVGRSECSNDRITHGKRRKKITKPEPGSHCKEILRGINVLTRALELIALQRRYLHIWIRQSANSRTQPARIRRERPPLLVSALAAASAPWHGRLMATRHGRCERNHGRRHGWSKRAARFRTRDRSPTSERPRDTHPRHRRDIC